MKLLLSCPSKTFLLGEYAVMNSGAALLFNSEPRFQLIVNLRGTGEVEGIHPASPAAQWMAQNRDRFGHADLQFVDPHNGLGGFGASSAQFVLVHALAQFIADGRQTNESSVVQVEPIWRDYRNVSAGSRNSNMMGPSGADIVAQFAGGLCEVNLEPFSFSQLSWPFEEFEFTIVRTGKKVATHEHLNEIRRVDTDELNFILERGLDAFETKDSQEFFDAVNDYYGELSELGLVADRTQVYVSTLLAQPFVRAAKGCGALGADTIVVFFATEYRLRMNRFLAELQLPVVTDSRGVSSGFRAQIDEVEA